MDDFKVIETQEQLEAVLKDRLSREQKKHNQEKGELQSKIDELTKANADLTNSAAEAQKKYAGYDDEIKGYKDKISQLETDGMKRRIAYENGLPMELASRLIGTSEDEIKADAQNMAKYARTQQSAPLARPEPTSSGNTQEAAKRAALSKLANSLTGGNQ